VLIPLLFGDAYSEAVPVAQVMLLVVPIVYATGPLLVIAYSHGRERSFLVPFLLISLGGTVAIVAGQAVGGATLAAAGYVGRSASILVVVGVVTHIAWRRHVVAESMNDVPAPRPASVQTL
jgi:O-antigen/teichoic acid export membrane protein